MKSERCAQLLLADGAPSASRKRTVSRSQPFNSEIFLLQLMLISLVRRAAIVCALALAIVPVAAFSQWTTFTVAQRESFSFTHAHHPDGRFLFGTAGGIRSQDTFGVNAFTTVANNATRFFDPAFIAVRSSTSALIGGGGFFPTNNGLFPFNPTDPLIDIGANLTPTLPNAYAAVWWSHPTSGREGWLFTGGNAGGKNNISFLTADGTIFGPVTAAISSFSGGLAINADGDVFTLLADSDDNWLPTEFDNQLLKFTANQIDSAVAALLASSSVPLQRQDATALFTADASSSLAIDSLNRVWIGGYQIPHLQLWDPISQVVRRVAPLATAPLNYAGPPSYAVKSFTQSGTPRVSFLANDASYAEDSDLILGHSAAADIQSRSIEFAISDFTIPESNQTVTLTLSIVPAPTTPVTVPITISGTATQGSDFTFTLSEIVCTTGATQFTLDLMDDSVANEAPETITLTLGRPTPHDEAGLGPLGTEKITLTIFDNDVPPAIATTQSFPTNIRVGSAFSHQVETAGMGVATKWKATGLPPGLRIDPTTGIISGVPTTAGDFDRLVITASNAFGQASSIAFLLDVQPLPAAVVGQFSGLIERAGNATGELGGRLLLTTTASSTFTAALTIGKKRLPLRGELDSSSGNSTGTGSVVINGVALPFAFTIDALTSEVTGSVGSSQFTASLHRPQPSRTGLCHFLAFQNLLPDDRPQGFNFGTVLIPSKGLVRIVGRTADGSRFTSSSAISENGEVFLYQALYRQLGTLSGLISVGDDLQMNLVGLLDWSKPSQISGALYRNGWPGTLRLNVTGGKYRPAAGAALPLNALPSSANNAQLGLALGGIDAFGPDPLTYGLRIVSLSRVITASPLSVRINNRTGLVSGRLPLTQGNVRRTASLVGLLIPSGGPLNPFQTDCYGYFVLPTATRGESRSGQIQMTAD